MPKLPRPPEAAAMVSLSDQLTRSLRAVLESSPVAGLGPIEVARVLGLDKTFASRLMSALRAPDSLVALSLLPGVVPLRQFIVAAREAGASDRAVKAAERRLRAFDHELQRAFGTRTRLDAALTDALPEARRRHEDAARQAVYRGMALLKGVSIDLESVTWVVHPSRGDPSRVDVLFVAAFVGMHRLRAKARLRVGGSHTSGRPEHGARLLREFCRPARLSITSSTENEFTFYEISTGSVRRDDRADVVLTEFHPGAASLSDPAAGKPGWSVGDLITHPTKRLEMTLFVHQDAWRRCEFSLLAYDTAGRGLAHHPDPGREIDRLSLETSVATTLATSESLRASSVPEYEKILSDLTSRLGWTWEGPAGRPAFRKIGVEIAYPLYGAQILLVRAAQSQAGSAAPPVVRRTSRRGTRNAAPRSAPRQPSRPRRPVPGKGRSAR